jgi:hypothetical protein
MRRFNKAVEFSGRTASGQMQVAIKAKLRKNHPEGEMFAGNIEVKGIEIS